MAVSSLTRLTVPLATSQSASTQGLLMPKLKYRFRATFENFGVSSEKTELTKQVVDIKRPNVNFNPITLDVYNSKVYLQGKPEWQDVTVNLRDDAAGNVSRLVGEQIQKQFDFAEQSSAASGIDYKFLLRYEVLDGGNGQYEPNVLETWELYGCLLSSVDYGDMAYSSNDPAQIALTIKFDNAIQSPTGTGVGTLVGRTLGTLITG
jgi:hypothetical protein